MIDFDRLIFYSNYPESISFEEYIPNNWEGYLQRFDEQVLYEYRYWEDKNKNYVVRDGVIENLIHFFQKKKNRK